MRFFLNTWKRRDGINDSVGGKNRRIVDDKNRRNDDGKSHHKNHRIDDGKNHRTDDGKNRPVQQIAVTDPPGTGFVGSKASSHLPEIGNRLTVEVHFGIHSF
jgi:hypothetical protein